MHLHSTRIAEATEDGGEVDGWSRSRLTGFLILTVYLAT
jgi:hypothetical protein